VPYVGRGGPGAWSRGAVATLEGMARLLDLALRVEDLLADERRLRQHQLFAQPMDADALSAQVVAEMATANG